MALTHTGPLGEDLATLGLVLGCPRRAVTPACRSSDLRVKCRKQPESRLAALSSWLSPVLKGQGTLVVSAASSERQCHLSQMHARKGEPSLPVPPGGPHMAPLLPGLGPPAAGAPPISLRTRQRADFYDSSLSSAA